MSETSKPRLLQALVAGTASFIALEAIFVSTMLKQYQMIDWQYLSWASLRILGLSLIIGLILFNVRQTHLSLTALLGAMLGFALGVGYVVITINA